MKRSILFVLALIPIIANAQQINYSLTIKLPALKSPAKAYLVFNYGWSNARPVDSAELKNGAFVFKGTHEEPEKTTIYIDHKGTGSTKYSRDADVLQVFIDNSNILVTGTDSVKHAVISGSKLNDEYARYSAQVLAALEQLSKEVNKEYAAASEEKRKDHSFTDPIMAKFRVGMAQQDSLKYIYINQHPDSYLSLMALTELSAQNIDVNKVEPVFGKLSDNLKKSKSGQQLADKIAEARATAVGSMAPGFTENDVNDKPVNLSDFKGKYVLLDFWASWCGPCRAENPNVLKAYNKYKDKNFTVLGVSLDNKKEAWLAAIKADNLNWTQLSDLNAWRNKVAQEYFIKAIPQNFLIDPSGKIIGKNLRGEDLEVKLSSILN